MYAHAGKNKVRSGKMHTLKVRKIEQSISLNGTTLGESMLKFFIYSALIDINAWLKIFF